MGTQRRKYVAKLKTHEWIYWVRGDGVVKRSTKDRIELGVLVASVPNLDGFNELERSSFGDYFAERLPINATKLSLPPRAKPDDVRGFMLSLKPEKHYVLQDGKSYCVLPHLVETLPH